MEGEVEKYYLLYGLVVKTPFIINQLEAIQSSGQYDIEVLQEELQPWIQQKRQEKYYAGYNKDCFWFEVPDIMVFSIYNKQIIYSKLSDSVSDELVKSCLLSSGIAIALMLRGFAIIHGSGLAINNKGIIISGASGSGKSTTATGLLEKGFSFVSDDICSISYEDSSCFLHTGPPLQNLCENESIKYQKDSEFYLVDPVRKKFRRKIEQVITTPVIESVAMFILRKEPVETVFIKEVNGIDKLYCLTSNMFRGEVNHLIGLTPERVQLFTKIASKLRIYDVYRPENKDTQEQIQSLIYNTIMMDNQEEEKKDAGNLGGSGLSV